MTSLLAKLKSQISGIRENEALAPYTSFGLGGPAKFFYCANNNAQVQKAAQIARKLDIATFILGSGTNILVSDAGFDGLVIKMENSIITIDGSTVNAESGAKLQKVIRETISHHLSGMEFLLGIPGTIGGAVAGNVGTPTTWIDKVISEIEIIDTSNHVKIIPKSQCDFSYRFSRFKYSENEIILGAKFQLEGLGQKEIQANVQSFLDKEAHQPVNNQCAGSIFKNPRGEKAWQLIDKVGLRGKKIGGAQVSNEHANFIVNLGTARSEDVVILISYIKEHVRDRLGTQLQEEIKYIGF